jgi:hypothetical protein
MRICTGIMLSQLIILRNRQKKCCSVYSLIPHAVFVISTLHLARWGLTLYISMYSILWKWTCSDRHTVTIVSYFRTWEVSFQKCSCILFSPEAKSRVEDIVFKKMCGKDVIKDKIWYLIRFVCFFLFLFFLLLLLLFLFFAPWLCTKNEWK